MDTGGGGGEVSKELGKKLSFAIVLVHRRAAHLLHYINMCELEEWVNGSNVCLSSNTLHIGHTTDITHQYHL